MLSQQQASGKRALYGAKTDNQDNKLSDGNSNPRILIAVLL